MSYGSVAYCAQEVREHLDFSKIKAAVVFSGSKKFYTDKGVVAITAGTLTEPISDVEERLDEAREILKLFDLEGDGTVLFQCQYGKSRSYSAASAFSAFRFDEGPTRIFLDHYKQLMSGQCVPATDALARIIKRYLNQIWHEKE